MPPDFVQWAVLFEGERHEDGTGVLEAVIVYARDENDAALRAALPRCRPGKYWPVRLPDGVDVALQAVSHG